MNILTNEKTIRRNGKIGNYVSLAGIGLMLLSAYFMFRLSDLEFAKQNENYNWFMGGSLFGGFILIQIGSYFMNRFGRRPRPEEVLITSLKGLTKDYTLYNYLTPVNYLLVGPAGVWIIEYYYQRGNITYKGGRWHQKGGGIMLNYMKIFGQEGLGRPDLEVKADLESLTKEFQKALGEDAPPVNALLVFGDERANIAADEAPNPTMKIKELKEFLRKYAKANRFSPTQIERVTAVLPEESIV